MQITLLPPLLPTEGVTSVPTASLAFTPGMKVVATVLSTDPESGTLLSLFGRQIPMSGALPHPPGASLRLEVVEGGPRPLLRLVSVDPAVVDAAREGATSAPSTAPGPPVSVVTYALAAAVFAAREAPEVGGAAATLVRWIPVIVARGSITPVQGDALLRALAPVPVHVGRAGTPEAAQAGEAVAQAIAARVAQGGLLLERRLADVVRQARPDAERVAAGDIRARLAMLADALRDGASFLEPARAAVAHLQQGLLAEQARTAAHLAREGVVDVRIPLQADGDQAEVRLRMRLEKDARERDVAPDPAPWRQVTLDLVLEGLGRVHVRLGVVAAQAQAEFVVEEPGAADRIEARLAELELALEGAGFARVLSRVVIDPVRASTPDDLPELPPQHSIVDVRA